MSIDIDIDLRGKLGDARDQRQRPTCLVFAVSGAHEANRATNEYLSCEYLFYSGARRSHCDPKKGLTATIVQDALHHDGQPPETSWPYLPETPGATAWKPPGTDEPLHRAKLDFSPRTLGGVRELLMAGKPVLLGIALTIAMYTPDQHGIVRVRANDSVTTRRHALLAVGSGRADDGEYILVRNSWGTTWGDRGHAWLHDAYLTPQMQTTAVIF